MRIQRLIYSFCLVLLLVLASVPAYGLRCNGRIVSIEDTASRVIDICGEPHHVTSWEETRIKDEYRYHHYKFQKKRQRYFPPTDVVNVEEWTYNFGPTVFIRYLLFENGRLKEITLGDKGHYRE